MKIEVELEDQIYSRIKDILGDDVDIGVIITEMLKGLVIIVATHPEEFIKVFSQGDTGEARQIIDNTLRRLTTKILAKARKKEGSEPECQ